MHIAKNNLFNLFFESFKNVNIPKITYVIPHKKYKVVKIIIPYSPPVTLIYYLFHRLPNTLHLHFVVLHNTY